MDLKLTDKVALITGSSRGIGLATARVASALSRPTRGRQKGGPSTDPVGFDAGKKIQGIKRHTLIDHQGGRRTIRLCAPAWVYGSLRQSDLWPEDIDEALASIPIPNQIL
jgi:NAD(P)-dependent dehydrogenase (short-subunit alcohol dehydrogenase family)